jgi:hypothetical protein
MKDMPGLCRYRARYSGTRHTKHKGYRPAGGKDRASSTPPEAEKTAAGRGAMGRLGRRDRKRDSIGSSRPFGVRGPGDGRGTDTGQL